MATLVLGVGYIGSRLVQELLYQGREVVAVDNFFATDRRAIDGFRQAPSFRFFEGSIVDLSTIDSALDASGDLDSVYLLAAQASSHASAAPAEYSEEVNLRGPRIVLDALARRRLDVTVVFGSSMRVYGLPLPAVVNEATPYGVFADLPHLSKCYVEKLLEMYAMLHHFRARAVRLGLVYGVAPVMKTDPRFMTAPNLFCYQAANGAPLEIRTRDPLSLVHVDDAVESLLWAAEHVEASDYAVFNAAPSVATLADIATQIREVAETRDLTVTIRDLVRSAFAPAPVPIITSALSGFGFVPRRDLAEGIAETLDHFLVHGQ